jgi:hypothetical protein
MNVNPDSKQVLNFLIMILIVKNKQYGSNYQIKKQLLKK